MLPLQAFLYPQFLCPSASFYGYLSIEQIDNKGKKILVPWQFPTSNTHPHQVNWKAALLYFTYWSTIRWGIENALSLPSKIQRSAYPLRWDRDLEQRKSLAYPRYDPLPQAIFFASALRKKKPKSILSRALKHAQSHSIFPILHMFQSVCLMDTEY